MNDQTFGTISACVYLILGVAFLVFGVKEGRWGFGIMGLGFLVANLPDLLLEGPSRHLVGLLGLAIVAAGLYFEFKSRKRLAEKAQNLPSTL